MKALLIIDMQKGCFPHDALRHDSAGVISRINDLSDKFRQHGYAVIFVRHDGTNENELIPDTDDWQILEALRKHESDLYVDKTANDSFYKTTLSKYLSTADVTELYVTGAATDFCIDATVKSALARDYKVFVVADAHTTEDKVNIKASDLIDHYNWVWSVLAPTRFGITVLKTSEVKI
jgi:nicotinamidase-related amidase